MSWERSEFKCRDCEKKGREKYLLEWDTPWSSSPVRGFRCKRCCKYDPGNIHQMCACCNKVFNQEEMPKMCGSCAVMICKRCVKKRRFFRCFAKRCIDKRICPNCFEKFKKVSVRGRLFITCERHQKCNRILKSGKKVCRLTTKPGHVFCKRHRYYKRRPRKE